MHNSEIIQNWVKSKASIPLNFTLPEILLGFLKPDHFMPVNNFMLCAKIYILFKLKERTNSFNS